jgi:hypothetical protein
MFEDSFTAVAAKKRPTVYTTEHTDCQWPLSGVHSIMMVKSAQPGDDAWGGARPPPFTLSTIMSKVVVYAPAERADALLLFLLYPHMYSVVYTVKSTYINIYLIRGPHFFLLCNWLFHQLAMAG